MPFPLAAAISAGAGLIGGGISSWETNKQNRRSEAFTREMYDRQFADNYRLWQETNAYNSPAAQMQRYKDAGLNPHLIYGQGGSTNAAPISAPDPGTPQFRPSTFGETLANTGTRFLHDMYDLDIKQAQADNLKAQNDVIKQDGLLKAAQILSYGAGTRKTNFETDFLSDFRDINADYLKERLRQTRVSTDLSINKDIREAALLSNTVTETAERILTMKMSRDHTSADIDRIRANIELMKKDGVLKDLDINLKKKGINPNDPMWARVVAQLLTDWLDRDPVGDMKTYLNDKVDGVKKSYNSIINNPRFWWR